MKKKFNNIICWFLHKVTVINNYYFIDAVSGEVVKKYHCNKCNRLFMASNKSMFRVSISEDDFNK